MEDSLQNMSESLPQISISPRHPPPPSWSTRLNAQQYPVLFGCVFWVCSEILYLQFVLGGWIRLRVRGRKERVKY